MKIQRAVATDFSWQRTQTANPEASRTVQHIVHKVRTFGESAVREATVEFDGCVVARNKDWSFRVQEIDLEKAWASLSAQEQEAFQAAANRIRRFHEALVPTDREVQGDTGERMGIVWRPLARVGVYAPGGRGAYPSTVLMDVIPAQVAQVPEIVLVSPPARGEDLPHRYVLAAAYLTGIKEIYRMGGAQSIAALAYGTDFVRRVDKIVGPGNLYVALAKREVMGDVGIDSIAGPSEVFIVADETTHPAWVAADMLAQAEHDVEAGAVCVSTSRALLDEVEQELQRQLASLPRREIAEAALVKWGSLVLAESLDEAIMLVNESAPEHVELLLDEAQRWLPNIQQAGAVFLGHQTPEPVGDYYAGTNHVLPTHGSARYASGLGVHDFLRRMSYVEYGKETLMAHANHIVRMARTEALEAHARSVLIRTDSVK